MSRTNLLLSITNGTWLIEPSAIQQFGPIVKSIMEHNIGAFDGEVKTPSVMFVAKSGAVSFADKYTDFSTTPVGSVAVITISGAIMKQDNCGDPGSASLMALFQKAANHPNVSAILLKIDSPGGHVSGTEDFATVIRNSKKPVVTYVDGLMASAAYWLGSQSTEIYAGNKTDMIGSIGTMLSFADAQPMWEAQGVVFHDIYATASKEKNKEYADARKGNYAGVIERLDAINTVFTSSVKEARGSKLNTTETLSGNVFMAEQAIEVGLIDGMKSFDEAVARAHELATQSTSNKNQSTNKPMKLKAKFTTMVAFLSSAFTGFKAEETDLTEEHIEKMNTELATLGSVKTELQTAKDAALKATSDLATLQTAVDTLTGEKATLTTANQTLTEKVAELGSASAGSTITDKTADDKTTGKATGWEAELAKLPHNQAVDANPLFDKKA